MGWWSDFAGSGVSFLELALTAASLFFGAAVGTNYAAVSRMQLEDRRELADERIPALQRHMRRRPPDSAHQLTPEPDFIDLFRDELADPDSDFAEETLIVASWLFPWSETMLELADDAASLVDRLSFTERQNWHSFRETLEPLRLAASSLAALRWLEEFLSNGSGVLEVDEDEMNSRRALGLGFQVVSPLFWERVVAPLAAVKAATAFGVRDEESIYRRDVPWYDAPGACWASRQRLRAFEETIELNLRVRRLVKLRLRLRAAFAVVATGKRMLTEQLGHGRRTIDQAAEVELQLTLNDMRKITKHLDRRPGLGLRDGFQQLMEEAFKTSDIGVRPEEPSQRSDARWPAAIEMNRQLLDRIDRAAEEAGRELPHSVDHRSAVVSVLLNRAEPR